ncbi:MAG: hypothetical protein M1453_10655 [Acidobacteria bacterium]|nr:hypothetical protein [Acidobacteriota bacterium]MCL5288439.1 hypothetical protein [Acidobacteriota bacterium]
MFSALRYYWIIAKGYRLHPWDSPYLRWRLETFFGKEAANLGARGTIQLLWRERARLARFLQWVETRQRAQAAHRNK